MVVELLRSSSLYNHILPCVLQSNKYPEAQVLHPALYYLCQLLTVLSSATQSNFILDIATVRFGGNFCFGTMIFPFELNIDDASDTLAVPSKLCTIWDGFGTVTDASVSLSYISIGILYWLENSCNPLTFPSLLIDEIFLMLIKLNPLSFITTWIPNSISSLDVFQWSPNPTTRLFGL